MADIKDDQKTPEKEESQRRIYVFPNELYERIIAYQKERGLPSEVEAVRRLLDDALKSRDDAIQIIRRFKSKLVSLRVPSEVAKDVLVGHPLITQVGFVGEAVTFHVKDDTTYKITAGGEVYQETFGDDGWEPWFDPDEDIPF